MSLYSHANKTLFFFFFVTCSFFFSLSLVLKWPIEHYYIVLIVTSRNRAGEERRPCVPSVTIILFEITLRQTLLSFEWIFW